MRWNRYTTGQNNHHMTALGALSGMEPRGGGDKAVPFPEHLRHRIRRKDGEGGEDGNDDDVYLTAPTKTTQANSGNSGDKRHGQRTSNKGAYPGVAAGGGRVDNDLDEVDALLSDYDELMAGQDSYDKAYDRQIHPGADGGADTTPMIREEDLPHELPTDVGDASMRRAWKGMTLREKRQSIHFLFPRGDTLHRKGTHGGIFLLSL